MTHELLRNKFYELTASFYGEDRVIWGRSDAVALPSPYVCLSFGDNTRHHTPMRIIEDGMPVDVCRSSTIIQVDLLTNGKPFEVEGDMYSATDNTAVSELTEFVNFLNSAYVDEWREENDVTISADTIRDLTELINDTTWKYRAMVEVEVCYTQTVLGYTGTNYENGIALSPEATPITTPEKQALADKSSDWFDKAEITEK